MYIITTNELHIVNKIIVYSNCDKSKDYKVICCVHVPNVHYNVIQIYNCIM